MRDVMLRVLRLIPRRLPPGRDERGGVGVLVAILLGGGVLLGMGALVVDVGQLYQNRAELQNGADAAAISVAKSCILGLCAPALAAQYAAKNASALTGGAAGAPLLCGSGSLGPCPASNGTLTDCPPAPPGGASYVDVHTATKTGAGSTLLPPVFARALLGNANYQGTRVLACAQAVWGAPSSANTIAFTISACTWDQATSQGTSFAPPPPYPPNPLPAPSFDQVIRLHGSPGNTNPQGCPTEPAGADGPGNFGWTTNAGTCNVTVSGGTYGGNTGTSVSQACKTALQNAQANKTLLFMPVYVSISGTGGNATYTLKGFAAFVVTGYHLPGFVASDWLNKKNDCKGNDFCINGYFTQGLIPSTGGVGGNPLGAYIIKLTG